jgi:hypothetical protein
METIPTSFFSSDNPQLIFPLPGQIHHSKRAYRVYGYYESQGYWKECSAYHDSVYLGKLIDKDKNLYYSQEI